MRSGRELRTYLIDSLTCALDDKATVLNHWIQCRPIKNLIYLEDAIALQKAILDLHPRGDSGRKHWLRRAVLRLNQLHTHTGKLSVVDEAVELAQEAVDLTAPEDEKRASSCGSLAVALYHQADLEFKPPTADTLPVLDRMVPLLEEWLRCSPSGPEYRGDPLTFLGEVIKVRQQLAADDCWDELIEIRQEALAHSHPSQLHQSWLMLANDLLDVPPRRDNPESITLAKSYALRALEVMKHGHPVRFWAYQSLSRVYLRKGDLVSAIHYLRLTATDTPGNIREQLIFTKKILLEL